MAIVQGPRGYQLETNDLQSADFFEKGASPSRGLRGQDPIPYLDDTLYLTFKDRREIDAIIGERAHRIVKELDAVVPGLVKYHRRKLTP
jgi:hypothetical protein